MQLGQTICGLGTRTFAGGIPFLGESLPDSLPNLPPYYSRRFHVYGFRAMVPYRIPKLETAALNPKP